MLFFCHLETQNKVGGGGCLPFWHCRAWWLLLFMNFFLCAASPFAIISSRWLLVQVRECASFFNRTFLRGSGCFSAEPSLAVTITGWGVVAWWRLITAFFNEKKTCQPGFSRFKRRKDFCVCGIEPCISLLVLVMFSSPLTFVFQFASKHVSNYFYGWVVKKYI